MSLKSAIRYSDDVFPQPDQLIRLFHQAPWAKGRTSTDTEAMLRQTDIAICAWEQERLVGFGRVLTDFVYRATIWDVIVDQSYQGQGIGSEIVRRILYHPRLQQVELFWLCTRRPGFYAKLGFSSQEQTGMVWARNPQARWE
ncbi:MAG: GNAT family N-acetyltransferase [Nitrospira sp.]